MKAKAKKIILMACAAAMLSTPAAPAVARNSDARFDHCDGGSNWVHAWTLCWWFSQIGNRQPDDFWEY
jgi:hypothetical protein